MMKYVSVAEMQAIEREADAAGLSYSQMMENAGANLAEVVQDMYGYLAEEGALGLVGSGNNGGDALVALARLAQDGWRTAALLLRPRPADDALVLRLLQAGGRVMTLADATAPPEEWLCEYDLILDGVLGTGARLPLKPDLAESLGAIRRSLAACPHSPVIVAVDCPSGVDCDSGQAAEETLQADLTVCMAAVKHGLFKFPAYQLAGEIHVVGIGLGLHGGLPRQAPLEAWQQAQCFIPDDEWVQQVLPARPAQAHKGSFGTALVVAGCLNYTGALWLAGQAANRSGAGLVTLAAPAPLHPALAGHFPEATWALLPHENGFIAAQALPSLRPHLQRASALLLGPGLGTEFQTQQFVDELLTLLTKPAATNQLEALDQSAASELPAESELPADDQPDGKFPPLTLDADGLKLAARLPNWPTRLPPLSVLTPHPGEMALLTGLSTSEIQANRLETALRCSAAWGHVLVLKGAFTIIAAPDGQCAIIPVAHPALARAGTGDVLAGLITGLCAQGMPPFPAAVAAAWLHARAGLHAAETHGSSVTVLAGDVLQALPAIFASLI